MAKVEGRARILVVDDDANMCEVLERNLADAGHQVFLASGVPEAIRVLEGAEVDLVITDYKMPRVSGLELVRHVRENYRDVEIMMITGYASVQGAVAAVKQGAEEYLAKPFTADELTSAVKRVLEKLAQRRTGASVADHPAHAAYGLIGHSKAMVSVHEAIRKAAGSTATVLISGESGTGKELVARAVHYSSDRSTKPFIPVNCGGIPESLLESELFGYIKGAFTGAVDTRAGFFLTADGGTIFLDEISETSLAMQVTLLRVLQEKEVSLVGAARPWKVDVRVIAATNKDLRQLIQQGRFREDLFFRINVINIAVPPLRERGDDVALLVAHFTRSYAVEAGKPVPTFSEAALQVLKSYEWPGNVRELQNVVQRIVVMNERSVVEVPDLPMLMRFSASKGMGFDRSLAEVETEYVQNVLSSVGGNKTRAAAILGIDRKTLREKLKGPGGVD